MAHLVESFALSTGSTISHPEILCQFFPVGTDRYITVHPSSGMPAKNWAYFQELVDIIAPQLSEHGIGIVQIGTSGDPALSNCIDTRGKCNLNQTAYILKNTMLHIGNDSFAVHVCSGFDRPLIGIYSISPSTICGPYFGSRTKQRCLHPDYKGNKPSFNPNETPKTVNTINPEEVVQAAQELLNIEFPKIQTYFMGVRYKDAILEAVPDTVIRPDFAAGQIVNFRLDYCDEFDPNILWNTVVLRKSVVITDKPIDLSHLSNPKVRANVEGIFYDMTTGDDAEFVNKLEAAAIKYALIVRTDDEAVLNDLKLKYLDVAHINMVVSDETKRLEECLSKANNIEILKYKSNKLILGRKKMYLSKQAYKEDKPITQRSQMLAEIEDQKSFHESAEHIWIFDEQNNT